MASAIALPTPAPWPGSRRPKKDRIVAAHPVEPVLGHHAAVLQVIVAAPGQLVPLEPESELPARRLQHADALGHHFLADSIAGDHRDLVSGHKQLPEKDILERLGRETLFCVQVSETRVKNYAADPARRHLITHARLSQSDFAALGGVDGSDPFGRLFARQRRLRVDATGGRAIHHL
jgi:hypothetical protein